MIVYLPIKRLSLLLASIHASLLCLAHSQGLADGLVSYWPLDDGLPSRMTTSISDLQGANPLTLDASDPESAWLTGPSAKSRGALQVDGESRYVVVPSSETLDLGTNAVTLSVWVNLAQLPADLPDAFGGIFDSANDAYVLYLDRGANELRFKVTADGAQRPGIPAADLTVGEWMHVVGVYDGVESRIYANGELKDTHAGPTGQVISGQIAGIGRNGDEDRYFLQTAIDEMALWNRALTESEIQTIRDTGLVSIDDSEADGMRDSWEMETFGNLDSDGTGDGDNDGLTDLEEFTHGTLPDTADSDMDGLQDGDEVATYGSDPLHADTDRDGISDSDEVASNTSLTRADTDGDGLTDLEEATVYQTDGTLADSDGDGFTDSQELAAGTDPNVQGDLPGSNTVFLVRSAMAGETWMEPSLWSDGAAPQAGKHYVIPGFGADELVVMAEGETTFPGDSLAVFTGTQLRLSQAGTGVITIPSLVLNGGQLVIEGTTALTLAGEVTVTGNTQIALGAEGDAVTLASTLAGDGQLTVRAPMGETTPRTFILAGSGSTFAGDLIFDHVSLNARTPGSLGNGNVHMISSSIDIDYNAYNPESSLTLAGAGSIIVLDQFLIFKALIIAETTFPDGTYDFAAWEALDPNAADFIMDGGGAIVIGGDSDNDRLLDAWELRYFPDLSTSSGGDDPDGDTLSNEQEFIADTNPTLLDTDADTLSDAEEVNTHGTNPLVSDTDGDRLTDAEELAREEPSNPLRADTDADGLTDGDEVLDYLTNPLLADSDEDTYADAFEIHDNGDPLDANVIPRLAQLNLLDGLVSFWTFNDGLTRADTLSIADVQGRNHLQLVSPDAAAAWLSGELAKNDGSLRILGTETYVPVPNTPSLNLTTDAVTLSAWVQLDELPSAMASSFGGIFDSRNDAYVLYLDRGNAELRFKVTATGAERPGIPESELTLGEWLHIAGVYDGAAQESRIYLNGQLMDTHQNPTGTVIPDQIAGIGRNGDEDAGHFHGAIDDLGIWNVALTSTQINQLMEGPSDVDLDSDDDGLLDSWEFASFGNLDQDASGDLDNDGLDHAAEFIAMTHPNQSDSDNDGVLDGEEHDFGTDPLDATSAPVVVTEGLGRGLVAYWPLDDGVEDPSTTSIADQIGLSPLTLTSPEPANAWLTGDTVPTAGGVRVNGVDDYIVIPNTPALDIPGDTMSLSMWVSLDQLPSEIESGFAAIYDSSNDAYVFYLDRNNGELRFKVTATGAARPGIPEAELTTGEWMHITGVYDGPTGEARIYKNGVLMSTVGGVSGIVRAGQLAGIGRQGDEEANYFSGGVDDVAVWKRILLPDEIMDLANGASILGATKPDPDFKVTSIAIDDAGISLQWDAIQGRHYTVQYTEDLSSNQWSSVVSDLAAPMDGPITFTDTEVRGLEIGFYRILEQAN